MKEAGKLGGCRSKCYLTAWYNARYAPDQGTGEDRSMYVVSHKSRPEEE